MTFGIVSIGYQGRSIEEFVEDLLNHGVSAVVDVRMTPISRKVGFSKNRLAAALAVVGIDYVHLKSLGNPKDNRAPFRRGQVEEGRATYREGLAEPSAAAALGELITLARERVVAVLCFEDDPAMCHRSVVIDEAVAEADLPVVAVR